MRVQAEVVRGRGMPQHIELVADSVEAARSLAESQGYTVLGCRQVGLGKSMVGITVALGFHSKRIDITVFVEQLRDLITAGLSVVEALEALRGGGGSVSHLIARLEGALRAGHPLPAAMAQQPEFPPLLVALVHSSELTSDLPQTLSRFLEHERRIAEIRHRLLSASIYPLLLMGVGGLVLLFLFFYVMPRFARVFEGMAGDLPWSAQAMLSWSQFLRVGRDSGFFRQMMR